MSPKNLLVKMFASALLLALTAGTASAQWERISEADHRRSAEGFRGRSVCGDIWIDYAFSATSAGIERPQGGDCNIGNYNNGNWSSLRELISLVDCYKRSGRRGCSAVEYAYRFSPMPGGNIKVETLANGNPIGFMDVNKQSGQIVAAGGGNIVAAGGGNVIAHPHANLVGQVAASIVAAGGGNIVAAGGGNYTLQSVREIRVGRGLFQYGAQVRGKDAPAVEMTVGEEKLILFGNPSAQPGEAPAEPKKDEKK